MRNFLSKIVLVFCCAHGLVVFATDDFAALQKRANAGDADAMCELGRCYRNGLGMKKDEYQASVWTQKSASNGCVRAVGLCYEFGYGVTTNIAMAVEWYRKAADKGDTRAMNNLGQCYAHGEGVSTDLAVAEDWYRKAAKLGDLSDIVMFSSVLIKRKSYNEAEQWLLKAMNMDSAYLEITDKGIACRRLAMLAAQRKASDEAIAWLKKGVDAGDNECKRSLGLCYLRGSGVIKDEIRGLELIENAANVGSIESMRFLGNRYLKKDREKAMMWFVKLARVGDDYGKFKVAQDKFRRGRNENNKELIEESFREYMGLVDSKDKWVCLSARNAVAVMYRGGFGVKRDKEKALFWYEKAAETGDSEALQKLESFESECFDEETRVARKKKRVERGVGAIKDILSMAKQNEMITLSFKGFYLGMSVVAAHRLLVYYDAERTYSKNETGLVDTGNADNIFNLDYPSALVVRAKDGIVTEFVFSRRLIDKMFDAEGKSAEQFVNELGRTYPVLDKIMTKNVMIPDWSRRKAQWDLVLEMQGPTEHQGPLAGAEAAVKLMNARRILAGMEKPGVCYYQVSDKGFTLEITPNDGTPGEQVRFFVLKKKNK